MASRRRATTAVPRPTRTQVRAGAVSDGPAAPSRRTPGSVGPVLIDRPARPLRRLRKANVGLADGPLAALVEVAFDQTLQRGQSRSGRFAFGLDTNAMTLTHAQG